MPEFTAELLDRPAGAASAAIALAYLDEYDRQYPNDPRAQLLRARCLMDGGKAIRCEGLPPDAELEGAEVDRKTGQIVLLVKSAAWPASVLSGRVLWLELKFLA